MTTHQDPILIVDDNAANLKVARVALESEGYNVRTAGDGEEALAMLRQFRPRLILMDIQLPGVDGLELTRRLKADPTTRDIIIVAVTAYAMKGDREKALQAGCDGYIASSTTSDSPRPKRPSFAAASAATPSSPTWRCAARSCSYLRPLYRPI